MTISEKPSKLAIARELNGISQRELAETVNRSIHTVRAIEHNKLPLSPNLASSISAATGVTIAWLMNPDADPSHPDFVAQQGKKDRIKPLADKLRTILQNTKDFDLCAYKIEQFLQKMEAEITRKGS